MLGSATLAMVVSSTCIIVASMIETVISPLLATAGRAPAAAGAAALISRPPEPPAAPPSPTAASTSCPARFGRPRAWPVSTSTLALMPGAQRRHRLPVVEPHPERHPLHHLDPVAAGVLRRQERELRAGAGADRADHRPSAAVRIGVEHHVHPLAPGMWVRSVSLKLASIQVLSVGDQRQHRHRRRDVLPLLQPARSG